MATYAGRNSKFAVGANTVSEMSDWSIDIKADVIREDVFGTTWAKKHGLSATDWSASVNGLVDLTDTNGQIALENAVVSGTKLTDLRFYIDNTNYYTSDTDSDADAGAYITSYNVSTAQGDVAKVSISIEGTGPICKKS